MEEDAGEGTISGASGGVVVDETDGMNAPQTVGDGRLVMREGVGGLPGGSRSADILIHFPGRPHPPRGGGNHETGLSKHRDNSRR